MSVSYENLKVRRSLIAMVAVAGLSGIVQPAPVQAAPATVPIPAAPQPTPQPAPVVPERSAARSHPAPTAPAESAAKRVEIRRNPSAPALDALVPAPIPASSAVASSTGNKNPSAAATVQGPAQLGYGRAAVLFTRAETLAIAQGKWAPPGLLISQLAFFGPPGVLLSAILKGTIGTVKYIAQQYYNKGLCTAYTVSARPWDSQGFTSRKC